MKTAVLIMAAGQASRFGSCKQLTAICGQPLLQHAIDKANIVCPNQVFVVSGAWHQTLQQAFSTQQLHSAQLLYAPNWAAGLGHSIAAGVQQIANKYEAILILLADQIAVSSTDLQQLMDTSTGHHIACATYQEKRGVPAVFNARYFPELINLTGDRGAQKLLYTEDKKITECPMNNAIFDIDTQKDKEAYLKYVTG